MTYTVKYRRIGSRRWNVIQRVKGDGFVWSEVKMPDRVLVTQFDTRFFILEDETRLEIPASGMQFEFSPDRFSAIRQRMEDEAGRVLPIESGQRR